MLTNVINDRLRFCSEIPIFLGHCTTRYTYSPKQPESQKIVTTESFLLFFCLLIRQPDGIARWRQTEARKSHNNPHSIISHVFVFFGQILVLFNNYNCDSDSFNLDSALYRKILSKIQSIFMNTFSAMQIF